MTKETTMVGMSGGVDSSVAAWLLTRHYPCMGGTLRLWGEGGLSDARAVAQRLGIPHQVFDLRPEFEAAVVRSFAEAYQHGLTPNPCIICNRTMKFGALLDRARDLGCGYVATGHYARIRKEGDRFLLYKAADRAKDQTYFLACLSQDQLSSIRFPLGDLTKVQVREIAQDQGFLNARKRDSQDICFIPDGDYAAFLERYTGQSHCPGDFLDMEGRAVGRHRGAVCYTVGQRRGLGLAMGDPVYVVKKDMDANTVTVGPNESLYSKALRADGWQWYPFPALAAPLRAAVRIRHSQLDHPATLYPEENGFVRVEFDQPQRAVTPGQAVVAYDGDLVIGGGTIRQAL